MKIMKLGNKQDKSSSLICRSLQKSDIPYLVRIQEKGELFWSEKLFEHELKNPLSHNFVAICENIPIGFGCLWVVIDTAEIHNIFVATAYRGRGIGRDLLNKMVLTALDKGATSLFLELSLHNHAARKLYERFGFEEVGWRKNYFQNGGALIMSKSLAPQ